jgi:hypothetical protein
MTLIQKFFRLTSGEQKFLVKTSILLMAIQTGLHIMPFRKQYRLLVRSASFTPLSHEPDPAYLQQVVWAINKAGRTLLGPNTCLPQALAAHFLLKRQGFPARMVIGVRKDESGDFKAHAWVENDGIVVIGGNHLELESYTTLPNLEDVLV